MHHNRKVVSILDIRALPVFWPHRTTRKLPLANPPISTLKLLQPDHPEPGTHHERRTTILEHRGHRRASLPMDVLLLPARAPSAADVDALPGPARKNLEFDS